MPCDLEWWTYRLGIVGIRQQLVFYNSLGDVVLIDCMPSAV